MRIVDRITILEEKVRHRILGPLVLMIVPGWVKPNHVTFLRLCLVCLAIFMFMFNWPLSHQVWVLVIAALTDSIDGILARARKQVTRTGANLDQAADWFLGIWTGVLALKSELLPTAFIVLIVIPQLVILVIDRFRAHRLTEKGMAGRAFKIAMGAANFQVSIFSRFQFFTILLGFFLLLFSQVWDSSKLLLLGLGSLYTAVALAWLLVIENSLRLIRENQARPLT